ncbi:cupin domain-containing protein [Promicromonospora sp. NPDC019610]|uniref:cupin domain-containing protein n=1 Tax=Promicromonospora sp. NPDC019610 TaxID=3364405 RepID=UPI0037AA6F27
MSLPYSQIPSALHVPAGQGANRWFAGDLYQVLLTASQTKGLFSIVEASVPPGAGPIPHYHPDSDETFYMLDGELEFLNGDQTLTARRGDVVHIPSGTLHRFHNVGLDHAKMLFFYTPGGPEALWTEAGDEPVPGVPVPSWGPDRWTPEVLDAGIRHGHRTP